MAARFGDAPWTQDAELEASYRITPQAPPSCLDITCLLLPFDVHLATSSYPAQQLVCLCYDSRDVLQDWGVLFLYYQAQPSRVALAPAIASLGQLLPWSSGSLDQLPTVTLFDGKSWGGSLRSRGGVEGGFAGVTKRKFPTSLTSAITSHKLWCN